MNIRSEGLIWTYETFEGFARLVVHKEHGDVDLDVNSFPRIAYPVVVDEMRLVVCIRDLPAICSIENYWNPMRR
jgi:hypothetical protein